VPGRYDGYAAQPRRDFGCDTRVYKVRVHELDFSGANDLKYAAKRESRWALPGTERFDMNPVFRQSFC